MGTASPATAHLTAIEFRAIREYLGLDQEWIATRLALASPRQVRRWEAGGSSIPVGVCHQIQTWHEQTAEIVARTVEGVRGDSPTLTVPRDGEPDGWPARWHRHVAMRVAAAIPDITLLEQGDASGPLASTRASGESA